MAQERKPSGPGDTEVRTVITVMKPRSEIYRFWRNFENLNFMKNIESITVKDDRLSHWVARANGEGHRVEWDSEVIREVENELIEWRTVEGSEVRHGGMVQFADAPADKGTEVYAALWMDVPAGAIGNAYLKMRKEHPVQLVRADMRRFKQLLETGEYPTTVGQPVGHSEAAKEEVS